MQKFWTELLAVLAGGMACVQVLAQPGVIATRPQDSLSTRMLTMEEAVLGYELYPERLKTVWRPGSTELTKYENGVLYAVNPLAGLNGEIMRSYSRKTGFMRNSIAISLKTRNNNLHPGRAEMLSPDVLLLSAFG